MKALLNLCGQADLADHRLWEEGGLCTAFREQEMEPDLLPLIIRSDPFLAHAVPRHKPLSLCFHFQRRWSVRLWIQFTRPPRSSPEQKISCQLNEKKGYRIYSGNLFCIYINPFRNSKGFANMSTLTTRYVETLMLFVFITPDLTFCGACGRAERK